MASQPIKPGSRLRQASWAGALCLALTLFLALTFHVNAIKSQVRLAERKIVVLEREKLRLETEFESRASQRQLAEWNAVEFGYVAPRPGQFLTGETQLAALGAPLRADAPQPIRVARAAPPVPESGPLDGALGEWVSPLSGQPLAAEPREVVEAPAAARVVRAAVARTGAARAATLAERLGMNATGEFTDLAEAGQ